MTQWSGKEINVYVTTEADNICDEEQMPWIAEDIPPTSAASKALAHPNQDACESTADGLSENLII